MTPTLNPEVVHILDRSIGLTLVTFLVLVAAFGLYGFYSFNRRRLLGSRGGDRWVPRWQILRPLLYSMVISLPVSVLFLFFFAFAPAPFLDNFSTADEWQRAPLRITELQFDRFHEGFSLDGEVWNQSPGALQDLRVVVTVVDHNREDLDELLVTPDPASLKPGETARFEVRYEENSNLIHGYLVKFRAGDGTPIHHVAGFNVEQ